MIVAIPLDDTGDTVCVSFGRAPYYLFYNTETKTSETILNPAAAASGGAGIKAAQFVADHHANALITVRLGENAAGVLQPSGIALYKARGVSVPENLKFLAEGELAKLESFHAGFHGQ